MPSGSSIRQRVSTVLRRLNATAKTVYFREVTVVGGDPLLGIGGTVTTTDVVADPQPAVDMLPADMVATSGGLFQMGDYRMIFSGATDETVLRNRLIVHGTDVLRIQKVEPFAIDGTVVAWEVIARTVAPGS